MKNKRWVTAVLIWIIGAATAVANTLTSPSVPLDTRNGVHAGDYLYLGCFETDPHTGNWSGNLKKYKLDAMGGLIDKNGRPATDSQGKILSSAQSYWSATADGAVVRNGGAGALLVGRMSRNLYTYVYRFDTDLTAPLNAFSISNKDNIALADLKVKNEDERQVVIKDIHGIGKSWVMADVLHSKPAVVPYDTNGNHLIDSKDDALIFVGTNGGVMHAFWDSNGQELWGFIPPHQLGRLKILSDNQKQHDHFLDGSPVVADYEHNGMTKKILAFGERRGGSNYYVLDITSYNHPEWKYCIGHDILGVNGEPLGLSWGRPQSAVIASGTGSTAEVLLLPGGYDLNQDAEVLKSNDSKGRAVFSVEVDSGRLGTFDFQNEGKLSDMTHCIVDLTGVDPDGDGITDSIYAPDLGGNMFAFSDADLDGNWEKMRLFNASGGEARRKIFFAPDVIRISGDPNPGDHIEEEKVGEMIFFGTGDIVHLKETKVKNRFYAVKNYWWDSGFATLTDIIGARGDGALHDATENPVLQAGTLDDRKDALDELQNRMGWFIDLEGVGEKVVSSPVVYNGTIYFTTFVPDEENSGFEKADGDTDGMLSGEARLYALDYRDGRAVYDHWNETQEIDPVTDETISSGGKLDRYIILGNGIPSAPLVSMRRDIAMLYVGVGGKLLAIPPKRAVEMKMYYWRELYSKKSDY